MVRRKISKPRGVISGDYFDEDFENFTSDLDLEKMASHSHQREQHISSDPMEDDNQHYCLRWNNYQTNMTSVFHQLLQNEAFVDVTLACNDLSLKAHKVVLSACSTYFQKLLLDNPCKHPTIIMPQDVCYADLKFIIEFVYRGEIDVSQEELQSLLRTADQLKIKGLCEVPGETQGTTPRGTANSYQENHKSTVSSASTAIIGGGGGGSGDHHRIELSPVPIVSRRTFSKIRRISTTINKHRLNTRANLPLSRRRLYTPSTFTHHQHITGDYPEVDTLDLKRSPLDIGADEDEPDQKMPAVLMLETKNNNVDGDQVGEEAALGRTGGVCGSDREDVWSPPGSTTDSGGGTGHLQPLNMTGHGLIPSQVLFPGHVELPPEPPAPSATPVPCPPQELIHNTHTVQLTHCSPTTHHDLRDTNMSTAGDSHCGGNASSLGGMIGFDDVKVKFETLRSVDSAGELDACSRMSQESSDSMHHPSMMITPHLLGLLPGTSDMSILDSSHRIKTNGHSPHSYGMLQHQSQHGGMSNGLNTSSQQTSASSSGHGGGGPKTWSQEDMELALDALRNHNMSLTKASATYGIPSTTLWQRAHRLGIDTPKKEGPTKSWTEDSLNSALEALRTGTISANKASKAYGIPSSTLYKIARREGIRLAAPFNAAPTTWSPEDLERALESIRTGQTSVQRASTEFGIPTGTLYGRCKREGIELSRSNPTPWSEDAMGEALEAVRVGQMSINQAAIHYNLPYSSLYGRFKRGKYETEPPLNNSLVENNHSSDNTNSMHATEQQQQQALLHQQYASGPPQPSPQQQQQPQQHNSMAVAAAQYTNIS